jgi:ABC-2 type transport system permease protein
MNYRGGIALIQRTWASWLQARGFFWVLAFGWMIPPMIYLFVWSTAAGEKTIAGMDRSEFIAYYLLIIVINQLTYSTTNWTVGDVIRYGSLNTWLLRPLPPIFEALASELAGKVVFMIFVLPVSGILAIFLKPNLHPTPEGGLLFVLAVLLAWMLRFLWGYWLALLAFWTSRADSLLVIQDSLVFLLSGIVAPFALLPEGVATVARWLPFRYMVGFPVEVLTGQIGAQETIFGLAIQGGWLIISVILTRLLWTQGVKNYSAVGG